MKRPKREPPPPKNHDDLTYVGRRGDIVTFGAPSAHDPQRSNLVEYDVRTGDCHCTCKHAETRLPDAPLACWHARVVAAAWWTHEYRQLPDARLDKLDDDYAAQRAELTAEQCIRWGLVGDELLRRRKLAGTATMRAERRGRGQRAQDELFGEEVA